MVVAVADNDTLLVVGGVAILGYVVYRELIKPLSSAVSGATTVVTDIGKGGADVIHVIGAGASDIGKGALGVVHFFEPGKTPGIIAPDKSKSIAARSFAPEPSRGAKGAPYQGQASAALHRQQAHAPKHSGATVKPGFAVAAVPPPGFGNVAPHKPPRNKFPRVRDLPADPHKHPKVKKLPEPVKAKTTLVAL